MILASILITNDRKLPSPLPRVVAENIDSLKGNHEGLEHILFDDATIRTFLADHFDRSVLAAYDELVPNAFRADLARYCILYKLGGVYADISLFVTAPFLPVDGRLSVFRDIGTASPWGITNAMISAPAGHKALLKSIEMVCQNVQRGFYGPTSLSPTGPSVFGKAIALTCESDEVFVGDSFRPAQGSARCLIDPFSDTLIAVSRKRTAGSLDAVGITTGNNYNELWNSREIYRSDAHRAKTWDARWLNGQRFGRGSLDGDVLRFDGADAGVISWGPYATLAAARYEASLVFGGDAASGDFSMDVAAQFGAEIIARREVPASLVAREPFRCTLPFSLAADTPRVEVRLHAAGPHKATLRQVWIAKSGV